MQRISITAGQFTFEGVFESDDAPETCAWFDRNLPFVSKVIHARWSGEAVWVPLGDLVSGLSQENHTAHPSRGDILFYPGGYSETEILFPYGGTSFASRMGPLAGNHFLTIEEGRERLLELGEKVLWDGAQDISFEEI